MKLFAPTLLILAAISVFAVAGCDSTSIEPAGNDSPGMMEDGMMHDHEGHDHGSESGANAQKIDAALAKLSPEGAASAREQKICPVSGEPLGSMGKPMKMDVEGQEVWICCEGCRDQILENPDKYLSKI